MRWYVPIHGPSELHQFKHAKALIQCMKYQVNNKASETVKEWVS